MLASETFSLSPHAFASHGATLEQLCAQAGVALSNAWATDDFFRIWAAADAASEDRSAGLRFGAEGIDRGYGVGALVGLHAPDLRTALAALSRYKRLTCLEPIEVETGGRDGRPLSLAPGDGRGVAPVRRHDPGVAPGPGAAGKAGRPDPRLPNLVLRALALVDAELWPILHDFGHATATANDKARRMLDWTPRAAGSGRRRRKTPDRSGSSEGVNPLTR